MSTSPYPGLRPFHRDEADIFFGRDEQVDQLLIRLGKSRFLAVVGPSGCGKSSLVHTGLLNALEAGFLADVGLHWRIATMQPGSHPMRNLATALVDQIGHDTKILNTDTDCDFNPPLPSGEGRGEGFQKNTNTNPASESQVTSFSDTGTSTVNEKPQHDDTALLLATLRRGPLGLIEALREQPLPENTNLLLVVDQFEEIFRYREHQDRDEADAFVALLLRSVQDSEFPVYVVITMRSDFLGDCALFPGLPEALNDGQFLTPRLNREQRRSAITGPARVFGAGVEPALVNRLLNDMGSDPDQLPVLQHALMRLWTDAAKRETKPVTLKLDDYEALGGWDNTLSNHADEAFAELDEKQQTIAEIMFRALTERSGPKRDTRRPVSLQTVANIADVDIEQVIPVIEAFRGADRSFLTPPEGKPLTADTLIDISHESLIRQWQRMKDWVEFEAKSAETYRRLEQTALLHSQCVRACCKDWTCLRCWHGKSGNNLARHGRRVMARILNRSCSLWLPVSAGKYSNRH
ncbi:MAG: ATP-binding protein [Methylococcales bacterium]|nr:ATP-binding protein [Methylococcales bacterium]